MKHTLAIAAAAMGLSALSAHADGLDDPLGPREVAVGEGQRAGAIGALATTLNPAGLPLTRELVFEGSYGYRPEDSASLIGVSACDSTNAVPGCFFYRYASATSTADGTEIEDKAHVVGASLARAINSRAMVGITTKYVNFKSDPDSDADATGFSWDFGGLVRLTDSVNLAAVGYNLLGIDTPEFPRSVGGGVFVKPTPQISLGFDGRWALDSDDETGRYGGGGEYFLTGTNDAGYPLRLGFVHDVVGGTYLTGGLGMSTAKLAIDIGARQQLSDGDELLITGSLRLFGPRM